jgi:hypothetical protein
MLLIIHIILAVSGLALSTVSLIAPSKLKIISTYILSGLTIASGSLLVIVTNAPILRSCIAGLLYLGIIIAGTAAASRRLARQESGPKI